MGVPWSGMPPVTRSGDRILLSPEYARREAAEEGVQVITAQVKASDLWSEGLLEEWGMTRSNQEKGKHHGSHD